MIGVVRTSIVLALLGAAGVAGATVSDRALWFVAVLTLLLSAFYSGSETAFIACDRIRIRHLADRGNTNARRVLALLDRPGHLLSAVLVGNNLANVACTTVVTAIFTHHYGARGATMATVILVPVMLIFAEVIPKGLFLTYTSRAALASVNLLRFLTFLLYPVVWAFAAMSDLLARLLPGDDGERAMQTEDVLFHIADSREAGLIATETKVLVDRALALQDLRAGDVLVPLEKVVMLDADAPAESYAASIAREGFSRFPLYRGTRDNVVAVMSVHEYMTAPDADELRDGLRPPERVGAETPITDILLSMRERGRHMVMIESGGTLVGMTTLEDILERFVGAIADEFH
jgi:putative hemolysin